MPMTGTTVPSSDAISADSISADAPQTPSPAAPPRGEPVPLRHSGPKVHEISGDRKRRLDDPRIPACLVSTILHSLLLILLALFTYREGTGIHRSLSARLGDPSTVLSLQAVDRLDEPALERSTDLDRPVKVEVAVALPILSDSAPRPATNASRAERPLMETVLLGSPSAVRLPGKGGLERRTPEGRREFGKLYGASEESEQAVELALAYLAAHQRDNGSWSFDLNLDPCNGQCRNSKKPGSDTPTPSTGATGLALLAFLGAGHTHHRKGPYQETVRRGLYYLRAVAAEAQAGYDWQQGSMYGHGIALMALAEALSMTSEGEQYDADLMALVQRGTSFTCVAQHASGSWGYVPGSPGDTTVTGWQVMSLVAAQKAGLPPHTNTFPDAKAFLMSTSDDHDYWFGYKGPPGEPTTTAIALTLLLYLGESPHNTPFYLALNQMADRGPTLNNIYHDYYATLALHHSRHWGWEDWNNRLRDHLVATQVKSGHEKGSWHFPDRWGDIGGRLYTTAMCAMTLEIYYRYMPLYESIDAFPL